MGPRYEKAKLFEINGWISIEQELAETGHAIDGFKRNGYVDLEINLTWTQIESE